MSEIPTSASDTGVSEPVFVYGALRSGTTLLRLMLKAHPGLSSPGEADFLFDHIVDDPAAPDGWRYDKEALMRDRIFRAKGIPLPDLDGRELLDAMIAGLEGLGTGRLFVSVHRNAQRMATLFPASQIVHLVRDPRDVARSSIGMGWAGTSYHGVAHWIGTERDWDEAAANPARVHSLRFEDLMADTEAHLGEICAFLGLEFAEPMRRYWEGTTYGAPDPAIAAKWRQKASPREIALIEGRVGDLLADRGYAPSGAPASPTALEAASLAVQNRFGRWRHNMRRYGAGLFLGHHAARVLGLRQIERRLAERQEAIRIRNLK